MSAVDLLIAQHVTATQAALDAAVIETRRTAIEAIRRAFCADLDGDALSVAQAVACEISLPEAAIAISPAGVDLLCRAFAARVLPHWEYKCCGAVDVSSMCGSVRYFMHDGKDPEQEESSVADATVALSAYRAARTDAVRYRDVNKQG